MAILVHASWNTFYAAALVQLFRSSAVLGSYLNLMMAACALAVVLVANYARTDGLPAGGRRGA